MKRRLSNPNKGDTIVNVIDIHEGGTGKTTLQNVSTVFDILSENSLGVSGGAAMLTSAGTITRSMIQGLSESDSVSLKGNTSVAVDTVNTYVITNYDVNTTYTVTSTGGSVRLEKDTIYFLANSVTGDATITVNGDVFNILKTEKLPSKPSITTPINNATNLTKNVSFISSSFSSADLNDTHLNSDWELSINSGFTSTEFASYMDENNKTSWSVSGLNENTTYYVRVRYRSVNNKVSSWSTTNVFTTKVSFYPKNEQAKLVASDAQIADYFGYSVSLSADGNTALIGAPNEDPNGSSNAGSAYIFTRSGTTWSQQAKLVASDASGADYFGWSVAISGDGNTSLIGAYGDFSGTIPSAGAAYIFTRSGTTWSQQAKITSGEAVDTEFFGSAVAISSDGNTALIGAYKQSSFSGATYIFIRSGTTWSKQAKLKSSDLENNDYLGYSVSLSNDGNTALVGAYGEDPGALSAAGAAYVFTRSGTTWSQQAKLVANDPKAGTWFSYSVSLSGDGITALIACKYVANELNGQLSASVYVFTRTGTTWSQQAIIIAIDASLGYYYVSSVAISSDGNTALIGVIYEKTQKIPGSTMTTTTYTGVVHPFTRSDGIWSQQAKLVASDTVDNDYFGFSVSISRDGSTALIGAYQEDPNGISNAGSAYVFV